MPRSARRTYPQAVPGERPKVVVVVPAFNESRAIGPLIAELTAVSEQALRGFEVEVVVVDDGSTDRTRAAAQAAGARVIALPYNMGIGLAVQTGVLYALKHGADFVLQVDGDGQHRPEEIATLLAAERATGADVVVGSRFVSGASSGLGSTTPLRWLAGRLLSWTLLALSGRRFSDTTSGFRLFNRRAAELVAHEYPDDYPEPQALVMWARCGLKIAETPVTMRARAHGRSSINWWRAVYYVVKVIFASAMDKVRK